MDKRTEYKRIEQLRALLKDRGKTAAIKHLNNLSDDKAIERLSTVIDIYNSAPDLCPKDLQELIDKFKHYRRNGNEQPLAGIYGDEDKKTINNLEKEINKSRKEDKEKASIISITPKNTDYELVKILKRVDKKAPELDQLIGNPFEQNIKNTPEDWQNKIDKLVFLEELFSVWENITKILNQENNDFNNLENVNIVRQTAIKIKTASKNPNSPYTVDDYIFVMQMAKDNPDQNNVAELVRMIRKHAECPEILKSKGLEDTTKPERKWIRDIDTALGIKRKLNTGSK